MHDMTNLDRADISRLAAEVGLEAWGPRLEEAALASVQAVPGRGKGEPIGSRFGGLPAVPPDFAWPACEDGEVQAFIAQVRLDEIPEEVASDWLPRTGILSFFYAIESEAWGDDASELESWRVFWFADPSVLTVPKRKPKDEPSGYLRDRAIEFRSEWTVPESFPDTAMRLRESEAADRKREAFRALREKLRGKQPRRYEEEIIHRFLGHPDLIQGDMEEEIEEASRPLRWSDRSVKPRQRAQDWRLLLQVDSDGKLGSEWCDTGRIYFWIREQDARERRFDRVWMILQSC
jgi:uncharacterized protein YwqG